MNLGQQLDEDKIKRLEQIKKFKNEKNLASYKPAVLPKAVSPPKKPAMSSVGGGYGKPPTSKDNTVPAKLNLSGTLDKKKTGKEQSTGGDDTIAGAKGFALVRHMKGPGSTVGGVKLAGQSPIKPKKVKNDTLDDDELSALSKQYRQYLPKDQIKALQDFQTRKQQGIIDDDELSALSKQFRPFLNKVQEKQ